MDLAGAEAYLAERIGLGIRPGNERIAALLEALGRPQDSLRAIAVAGTNGKFSVASMTSSVLESLGLVVGLYTSPHIGSVVERIRIAGSDVSGDAFGGLLAYLSPYIELVEAERGDRLTYFETITAMAIEAFFDRAVHVAVLEAGLGGEWDATNVVDAEVAVVTNIGLDHIVEFGGDLERAAWEKAGIVKEGAAVVTGVTQPELLRVVEERALERASGPLLRLGREIEIAERHPAVGGQSFTVRTPLRAYEDLYLPAFGAHQALNAALAVAAAESFAGAELDPEGVAAGLESVRLPARVETVARHPLVVVDGGHNIDSATAVLTTLTQELEHDRLLVVAGMLEDKQVEEVMGILAGAGQAFYLAAPSSDRAADPSRLAGGLLDAGVPGARIAVHDRVADAMSEALDAAGEEDLVLVFGSFYTAGEAKAWLRATGRVAQR
ncbi:MAG TPA: Mur ligase family protein [Actinomycetota bacterium]|nr:Mur ligase family protein [Actinomycetota bacterium]